LKFKVCLLAADAAICFDFKATILKSQKHKQIWNFLDIILKNKFKMAEASTAANTDENDEISSENHQILVEFQVLSLVFVFGKICFCFYFFLSWSYIRV